jgi:hypothetical protein
LLLVAGIVFLLARLTWPLAVRTFVALLAGIILPQAMIYAMLYLAFTYGGPHH